MEGQDGLKRIGGSMVRNRIIIEFGSASSQGVSSSSCKGKCSKEARSFTHQPGGASSVMTQPRPLAIRILIDFSP